MRSLGFDEQFACFVVHLINLKADESISYEKEDDIVVSRKDGIKCFIQVKNSADNPIRKFATANVDFWKINGLYGFVEESLLVVIALSADGFQFLQLRGEG